MKAATFDRIDPTTATDAAAASAGWFKRSIGAVVTRLRTDAADRALRRELASMDAFMLKDIGISEEELWRIRRQHRFLPRAWE